jgi:transcription elongation factor GreA
MHQQLPTYLFTFQKLDSLKQNLEKLLTNREEAVIELAEARSMGDLSENGRYKAARSNLNEIDRNIRQHKIWLKYAKIIKPNQNSNFISLGSTVVVESDGQTRTFTLVGKLEADPLEGKISNKSPIGIALMNKGVGEITVVNAPAGEMKFKIIKIK